MCMCTCMCTCMSVCITCFTVKDQRFYICNKCTMYSHYMYAQTSLKCQIKKIKNKQDCDVIFLFTNLYGCTIQMYNKIFLIYAHFIKICTITQNL